MIKDLNKQMNWILGKTYYDNFLGSKTHLGQFQLRNFPTKDVRIMQYQYFPP